MIYGWKKMNGGGTIVHLNPDYVIIADGTYLLTYKSTAQQESVKVTEVIMRGGKKYTLEGHVGSEISNLQSKK